MSDALSALEAAARSPLTSSSGREALPPFPRPVEEAGRLPKVSQATRLVELAKQAGTFFHAPDKEPYAEIHVQDHREVWPIKSKAFRQWLAGQFFQHTKGAIGGQAMQDALSVLSSMALFEGQERAVNLRIADCAGDILIDLGGPTWEAIRVTRLGWEIISSAPVAFRRSKGVTALPCPLSGGSVEQLREVLNIADESNWTLLVAFLLAALRPSGPFPVLVLDGEQGTGKTFISRTLKSLIDPAQAGNRGEPRDTRDLMIAATNGWLLSFDNLSRISPELSDGLCRLSTGGGLATRELYSDADEVIFDAQRPVIVNGIGDVVTRPDLVERSMILTLNPISGAHRREERALEAQLDIIRPLVLGALLNAVAHGLGTVDTVRLPTLPRMADFVVWVTACAPGLGWAPDRFLNTYAANQADAVEIGLEASPLVGPLRTLVTAGPWEGTASELLIRLTDLAGDAARKTRGWPSKANHLSNALKRLTPALRETGLVVIRKERTAAGRGLWIEQRGISSSSSSSAQHDGHDDRDGQIAPFSEVVRDEA